MIGPIMNINGNTEKKQTRKKQKEMRIWNEVINQSIIVNKMFNDKNMNLKTKMKQTDKQTKQTDSHTR